MRLVTARFCALVLSCGIALGAANSSHAGYRVVFLPTPTVFRSFQAYAYGSSGGQQIGFERGNERTFEHALLWNGAANIAVDLNPPGYGRSYGFGIRGNRQVGEALPIPTTEHAILWQGTAQSFVDLHPAVATDSVAYGVDDHYQVGFTTDNFTDHLNAAMWSGSAESYVNLGPPFGGSVAYAVDEGVAVGYREAFLYIGYRWWVSWHAVLWRGSRESMVDLNPLGWSYSLALGIRNGEQVGEGRSTPRRHRHALLWRGTRESVVDLNPNPGMTSTACATNGLQQVGYISAYLVNANAAVWSGTSTSFVNLHNFLPRGYDSSFATGIDEEGNISGYAWKPQRPAEAVLWRKIR